MSIRASVRRYLPGILGIICTFNLGRAAIVDSSAAGFTVKNAVTVSKSPEEVYARMLEVGKWWSAAHTFSGKSMNLSIDASANGCFCEKLEGGGSVRHLTVVFADPGKTLRMVGGLGPLQSMAVEGTMTWSLAKSGNGTTIEMIYTVGGYHPGGLQSIARPVDGVLLDQLLRLRNYIEKGDPKIDAEKK